MVAKADSSVYLELGKTRVLCSAFGPHPTDEDDSQQRGKLDCTLRFASFARPRTQKQPDAGTANAEELDLSLSLATALSPAVQLERYPRSIIALHALVLEDEGGALAAAIMCASLALADAGPPQSVRPTHPCHGALADAAARCRRCRIIPLRSRRRVLVLAHRRPRRSTVQRAHRALRPPPTPWHSDLRGHTSGLPAQ